MHKQPEPSVEDQLRAYYQTSTRYRDDLITHDEEFLPVFAAGRALCSALRQNSGPRLWNGVINQIVTSQGIQNGGVDISPLFLSVEKQKQSDLNLLAADALRLPFHDHSFDAVVAFEFIEHIPMSRSAG